MIFNKKGVTLIEVMIALVVLLFVSLALMQTALLSIDANMTNVLRDEAVRILEQRMSNIRNTPFDDPAIQDTGGFVDDAPTPFTRDFRSFTLNYNITRNITDRTIDVKQADLLITWTWKNQPYTHTVSTIVRRQ